MIYIELDFRKYSSIVKLPDGTVKVLVEGILGLKLRHLKIDDFLLADADIINDKLS